MQIIYKIFNPTTGEYEPAASLEECRAKTAEKIYNFYLTYAHNSPYSVVEVNDDGTEIWRNPHGDEILSPEQIQAEILKQMPTPQ